jgi:hypothetical protein
MNIDDKERPINVPRFYSAPRVTAVPLALTMSIPPPPPI